MGNPAERNGNPKTQVPNTGTWGTLLLSPVMGIVEVVSSQRFDVKKFQTTGPPAKLYNFPRPHMSNFEGFIKLYCGNMLFDGFVISCFRSIKGYE